MNDIYLSPHTEESNHRQTRPHKAADQEEPLANIVATTAIPKPQVDSVLTALGGEIQKSLSNKGAGANAIPGLVKIEKKKVPARKAQKGVPNPFKPSKRMDRPAKPLQQGQSAGLGAAQGHGQVAGARGQSISIS